MRLYIFDREPLSGIKLKKFLDQIFESFQKRMWLSITDQMFRAPEIDSRKNITVGLTNIVLLERQPIIYTAIDQNTKAP